MLPVALTNKLRLSLVGNGQDVIKRLRMLKEAGFENIMIYSESPIEDLKNSYVLTSRLPSSAEIEQSDVLMVVDLDLEKSKRLYDMAKQVGTIVNVEDKNELCDFYFTSVLRRGDLVFGISTSGKSPALAKRMKRVLNKIFPVFWEKRINEIANLRTNLRKRGLSNAQVEKYSNDFIDQNKWFDHHE